MGYITIADNPAPPQQAAGEPGSTYVVQPSHGHAGASVSERFELIVPGFTERKVEFSAQAGGVSGVGHRRPDPILGNDHVAVNIGLGVEDS